MYWSSRFVPLCPSRYCPTSPSTYVLFILLFVLYYEVHTVVSQNESDFFSDCRFIVVAFGKMYIKLCSNNNHKKNIYFAEYILQSFPNFHCIASDC